MGLLIKDIRRIIFEEYENLGSGGFGTAYKKNDFEFYKNKLKGVEKAHKITTDKDEAYFAELIKRNQNKLTTFPTIYNVFSNESYKKNEDDPIKYLIIRELITPISDVIKPTEIARIKANIYKIHKYVNSGDNKSLEFIKISGLSNKFIEFLIKLRKEYSSLNSLHKLDFHSGNVGVTKNGDYVLFDF